MPMDDNGTIRMNTDLSAEVLMKVVNQMDRTLQSFGSQINSLVKTLETNSKKNYDANRSKDLKESNRNFNNLQRDISKLMDAIHDNTKEIHNNQTNWKATQTNLKGTPFEHYVRQQAESINKQVLAEKAAINKDTENMIKQINAAWEEKEKKYDRQISRVQRVLGSETASPQMKSKAEKFLEELLQRRDKDIASKKSDIESAKENREENFRRVERESEKLQEKINALDSVFGKIISANKSSYIQNSNFLASRLGIKESESERLEQIKDEQLQLYESAEKAIERMLKDREDLTKEERENLREQLRQIRANKDIVKDLDPMTETFSKAGKSLLDAGKSILKTFAGSVFKTLEDKYLTSYKESFQNVYQSVESTRNTISARAKLSQGDFKELQDTIQDRIYSEGLESLISEIDVNDALVSLTQAGVTNKDILERLAFEQARLRAQGSSLDLGNEETLNLIRQFVQNEQTAQGKSLNEALDDISSILQQQYITEAQMAGDWSFSPGEANTQFNRILGLGVTGGKAASQIGKDISGAYQIANYLNSIGLDSNYISQIADDIVQKSEDQLSTIEKVLVTGNYGINRKTLYGKDYLEQQEMILNAIKDVTNSFAQGDVSFLPQLGESLGLNLTTDEIAKLIKETTPEFEAYTEEQLEETKIRETENAKAGVYYSKTYTHQKETENTMGKIANAAEQQYKGNEYVLAGFNAVEQGIDSLISIGSSILTSLTGSSFTSAGIGSAASGAGALGTIGGAAAGFAVDAALIYGAYKFVGKPLQEAIENSYQPDKTKDLLEKYEQETNLAIDQYNAATEELDRLNKLTKEEQKVMLLHKGVVKDQELRNLDDSKIQELFEKNVLDEQVNLQKEAEQIIQRQQILNDEQNVRELANAAEFLVGPEGNMQGKTAEEMFNLIAGQMGNAYKDIYAQYQSFGNLSEDELTAMAMRYGASSRDIENAKRQGSLSRLVGTFATKETLLASGFDDQGAQDVMSTFGVYERNLNAYQTANDEFHTKWSQVIGRNPDKANDAAAILVRYATENGVYPELQVDQNGLPVLNDSGLPDLELGTIGKHSWRFRTGLTNVPYDNYPAMLHKGERILTASEAEAYNEMSSYAISNLVNQSRNYGNSSNVFNTTSYGVSGFESSIDKQTISLSSILNQILAVLKTLSINSPSGTMSAAHRNVLRRNSSVSQINTLS